MRKRKQGLLCIPVEIAWVKLRPDWLPSRVRLSRVFLDEYTNELVFVIEGNLPIGWTQEGCQPQVVSEEDFK